MCRANRMTDVFARERFLPAIRANTSLCELETASNLGDVDEGVVPAALLEAEAVVRARHRPLRVV